MFGLLGFLALATLIVNWAAYSDAVWENTVTVWYFLKMWGLAVVTFLLIFGPFIMYRNRWRWQKKRMSGLPRLTTNGEKHD